MKPENIDALAVALFARVVRCAVCECVIGRSDGPDDQYVVCLKDGKTVCERCVDAGKA